jgi:hypothetical protein
MKKEEAIKKLNFSCRYCGGSKLDRVYDCLTAFQAVAEVHADATVYMTGPIQIIEDHGHWYRCHDCEASLVDWDLGDPIWRGDSRLVDWLLGHCPQDGIEPLALLRYRNSLIGPSAMAELLRVAVQSMKDTKEAYGEVSIPTANSYLVNGHLCSISKAYGPAKSWFQKYVDIVSKVLGPESHEVLGGLRHMVAACMGLDDYAGARVILKRTSTLVDLFEKAGSLDKTSDPLVEALHELAVSCRNGGDEIGLKRGFVFALTALSRCVSCYGADNPTGIRMIPGLRELILSFGIDEQAYDWLVVHADQGEQDFSAFLSVIDQERMFSLKGLDLEPIPEMNPD